MAPTFAPEHVVAQRYRILGLVGVGRTAEVYVAEDLSLHRRVVVKVLLADLARHEELRREFRDHIVRAATLSNPHLARVYDGGQESGAIFMISEYLSGGSLEDLLSQGRRFSVDDGARLGRDVAGALAYVHENGFVLGSLTPSKLLFDGEGRVRLTDVALAGLGDGLRERFTLDDARYFSPEQAVGEPATAKSDVYALALILFEAVTGESAFEGTTPETVLRARLSTPLPVRLELGTLDMVLAQAAVPDPRLRLDAEQFAARLSAVVSDGAPLVVRPDTEAPLLATFAPSGPRDSIGFQAPSADDIVRAPSPGATRAVSRVRPMDLQGPSHAPGALAGRTPRFEQSQYDLHRPTRRRGFLVLAFVIVLAAVAGGVVWKAGLFKSSDKVPSLIGESYTQAAKSLVGTSFTVSVTQRVHSTTVPANEVVSQLPAAGATATSGQAITVTVSSGPVLVTLPTDLVGMNCADATAALLAKHVKAVCPTSAAVYSSSVAVNDLVRVIYNHKAHPLSVPLESTVTLSLSRGPKPGTTTTTSSTTTTTTTTLKGEGARAVPSVVGDDPTQVDAAFHSAGLYYTTTGHDAGTSKWTKVLSESPGAGTQVAWHSTVTLTVQ